MKKFIVNLCRDRALVSLIELSVGIGLLCMLLTSAICGCTMRWWSAAFQPLADAVLTKDADSVEIILRSRVWELVQSAFS